MLCNSTTDLSFLPSSSHSAQDLVFCFCTLENPKQKYKNVNYVGVMLKWYMSEFHQNVSQEKIGFPFPQETHPYFADSANFLLTASYVLLTHLLSVGLAVFRSLILISVICFGSLHTIGWEAFKQILELGTEENVAQSVKTEILVPALPSHLGWCKVTDHFSTTVRQFLFWFPHL